MIPKECRPTRVDGSNVDRITDVIHVLEECPRVKELLDTAYRTPYVGNGKEQGMALQALKDHIATAHHIRVRSLSP